MNKYPTWEDVERTQKTKKRRRFIQYAKKFRKYIPSFIISVFLWLTLRCIFPVEFISENSSNYILSSIAQGLASLLALLFVIIFLLCQVTNRISMFSRLLNPDGYFLIGIFMANILLSLITIRISGYMFLTNLTISMCLFCLSSLFPFLKVVTNSSKEYGIRNLIANIEVLDFPKDNFRYAEFLGELQKIGAQNIVLLESEMIIEPLVEVLKKAIKSETNFQNRFFSFSLLAQIGAFAMIEKGYKRILIEVKEIIKESLQKNTYPRGTDVIFGLACSGVSVLLSTLKLHNKLDKETRYFFITILIRSLLIMLVELKKTGAHLSKPVSNIKKLQNLILAYLRKELISSEDYQKSSNAVLPSFDISNERKKEFKEYLEKLFPSLENSNRTTHKLFHSHN